MDGVVGGRRVFDPHIVPKKSAREEILRVAAHAAILEGRGECAVTAAIEADLARWTGCPRPGLDIDKACRPKPILGRKGAGHDSHVADEARFENVTET